MTSRASWIIAVLACVGGTPLVHAQTQCYRCSLDGTDCIGNTTDGGSGCDNTGGICHLYGNDCGVTGGGGGGCPPPPTKCILRVQQVGDRRQLLSTCLFKVDFETASTLFPPGRPYRVVGTAGRVSGAQSMAALLKGVGGIAPSHVTLVVSSVTVGADLGAHKILTPNRNGFVITVTSSMQATIQVVEKGQVRGDGVSASLPSQGVLMAPLSVDGHALVLVVQGRVVWNTPESVSQLNAELESAQADTKSYEGPRINLGMKSELAGVDINRSVGPTWGQLKVMYR